MTLDGVMYEFRMLSLVRKLFGTSKACLFLMGLCTVPFTHKNRSAYSLMGTCSTPAFGRQVTLPHPEPRFIDEIVLRKCYVPSPEFDISEDDVVVDAGANVGIFTIYAALRAQRGKVISIEPESAVVACVYGVEETRAKSARIVSSGACSENTWYIS